MVKRKTEEERAIEALVKELQIASDKTKNMIRSDERTVSVDDTNNKRAELVKLSGDTGEKSQSGGYIKKASAKVINKIHFEYELN